MTRCGLQQNQSVCEIGMMHVDCARNGVHHRGHGCEMKYYFTTLQHFVQERCIVGRTNKKFRFGRNVLFGAIGKVVQYGDLPAFGNKAF